MGQFIRILSIDGGGIRGILPGQVLVYIEKKIQELTGLKNARIAEYFDMIAGTSTGGILTSLFLCPELATGKPKFSAQEAVDLYLKEGGKIFNRSLMHKFKSFWGVTDEKYSCEPIESILKQYFGDLKLSQLLKPAIITSYEIEKRYEHFFTQNDAALKPDYDYYIRDVARATSAAPTYFEPAKVKSLTGESYSLVDGGVFANNPSLCALSEASKLYKNTEKPLSVKSILLLSIGTGTSKIKYPYEKARNWGAVGWIKPVIDIMMSGVSDTVDYQLKQIFKSFDIEDQYLRINPAFGKANAEMDDASPENLQALSDAGKFCADCNTDALNKMIQSIIQTTVIA